VLAIDSEPVSHDSFRTRFHWMGQMDHFRRPEGKRYAVCLKQAFDVLSSVMYLREREGSVLLIHGDTPLETALGISAAAECAYLLYGDITQAHEIETSEINHEPAILQYSSGTTGQPKLIARTWLEVEKEILHYNTLFEKAGGQETPVILVPVSHSFGLITGVLSAIARGDEPVIIQNSNPKFAMHMIKSTFAPIVYTVPFVYQVLNSLDHGKLRCRQIVTSGSAVTETILESMLLQADEVWQQYGCTEAGCISVAKQPKAVSEVGIPLGHMNVSIRGHSSGDENSQGEIVVKSGNKVIETKDLGCFDPDTKRLQLLGRMDDLINVSGLKVIPSEVERIIGRLPGVEDTIVFKTSHRIWGEAVKALVVANSGIREQDIRSWCIKHLPPYKVPSVIELTDRIERMPSGKVSRKNYSSRER
jgi:3,4-dihydroxybenzoate---[aryl-carrier protein] ligase